MHNKGSANALAVPEQVVSATSAPLKVLNDLLHTKAGRKAQNRLQTVAGLASSLATVLELLGLDATQPQTVLQVPCSRSAAACESPKLWQRRRCN